jgi:hypothetical protein
MLGCQPELDKVARACKFRPEIVRLTDDEKLAMLGNCIAIAGAALPACALKTERLVEYIKNGQPESAGR